MNKWIPSIITLIVSILIIVFVSCTTKSGETVKSFNGYVSPYQYDKITYLVFKTDGGIHVVNYTADSLEYEFLHSPTKITRDDSCKTE